MVIAGTHADVIHQNWRNPLGAFGQTVLRQNITDSPDRSGYLRWLKDWSSSTNRVLAGDILTALLGVENLRHDFKNLLLSDSHLGIINLAETGIKNLRIVNSFIGELTVGPIAPIGITIDQCVIGTLHGLSKSDRLPEWLIDPKIDQFDEISNVAKIRQAGLSKEQEIFVTVIHKTFFQPGSGRKEDAILRGLGATRDMKIGRRILSMLIEEGILTTYPGKEGLVYVPARKYTKQMSQILNQLKYSTDPLWRRLKT